MTEKIKVGGVIQNDQLASISVLAVKDRPGIAAAVLDALGQRGLNVQFVVQVIDHEDHDQMVLCVDRGRPGRLPGRHRSAAPGAAARRGDVPGPRWPPSPSSAPTFASAPASPGGCSARSPAAASTSWPSARPSPRSTASSTCPAEGRLRRDLRTVRRAMSESLMTSPRESQVESPKSVRRTSTPSRIAARRGAAPVNTGVDRISPALLGAAVLTILATQVVPGLAAVRCG